MKQATMRYAATALVLFAALAITQVTRGQAAQAATVNTAIPAITATVRKTVHIKAVRDFRKKFPAVTESWYNTQEGGFAATYYQNEIRHLAFYNHYGNWLYNESIYAAGKLNSTIRRQVLDSYEEYVINNVIELHTPLDLIYLINIQNKDKTRSKTVRITGNDMEVISDLTNMP